MPINVPTAQRPTYSTGIALIDALLGLDEQTPDVTGLASPMGLGTIAARSQRSLVNALRRAAPDMYETLLKRPEEYAINYVPKVLDMEALSKIGDMRGIFGRYMPNDRQIWINKAMNTLPGSTTGTLLHETGHAVSRPHIGLGETSYKLPPLRALGNALLEAMNPAMRGSITSGYNPRQLVDESIAFAGEQARVAKLRRGGAGANPVERRSFQNMRTASAQNPRLEALSNKYLAPMSKGGDLINALMASPPQSQEDLIMNLIQGLGAGR